MAATRRSLACICAAAVTALAFTTGCPEKNDDPNGSGATSDGVVTDTYTVRGVVMELPSADDPGAVFRAKHEAIPEFRGQGGTVGMRQMVMEFPVSDDLSLDGIALGDIVAITFDVEFNVPEDKILDFEMTKCEVLPADTVLDFNPRVEQPSENDD